MNELINTAKSQAKHEAILSFLGKNNKLALRVFLIVIAAGIMAIGYFVNKSANQKKYSEIFHRSLISQQVGETAKAREGLKKIVESSSAPSGVKSLASLRYSAYLLEDGKKSEAVAIYLEVGDCYSCDEYVRDLAKLLAVKVWMSDEAETKKADLDQHIKKLEDSSYILKSYIAEQRAFLALENGKNEEAKKIFEEVAKNSEKNPTLKTRAEDGIKMSESK